MRTIGKILILLALFSACLLIMAGCKRPMPGGAVRVLLTDAPAAAYSQVNIEITRMDVHYSDGANGVSGWMSVPVKRNVYDLLSLRNNVTAILAEGTEMPLGKINQLRLILGTANSVVLSDQTNGYFIYTLEVPSSLNTGVKINVDAEIESNRDLEIVLDFDAAVSIKPAADGTYFMNPVIKVKSVTWN